MAFRNLLNFPFERRQRHLMNERRGLTADEFSDAFTGEFDRLVANKLWHYLSEYIVCEGFLPSLDDNLAHDYGLAEEELDEDIILKLLNDFNINVPRDDYVIEFGVIDSPRRIVEFLSYSRNIK